MKRLFSLAALVLIFSSACTDDDRRPTNPPAASGRSEVTRSIAGKNARAVMEIEPSVASVGEKITWRLQNRGDVPVSYGRHYVIERKTGGSWTEVPNRTGFNFDLPGLRPGDETEPAPVAVYDKGGNAKPFEPGTYRFVLTAVYLGSVVKQPEKISIAVPFKVVEDSS